MSKKNFITPSHWSYALWASLSLLLSVSQFLCKHCDKEAPCLCRNIGRKIFKDRFFESYHSEQIGVTAHSFHAGGAGTCLVWSHAGPPHYCSPSPPPATLRSDSIPARKSATKPHSYSISIPYGSYYILKCNHIKYYQSVLQYMKIVSGLWC